MSRTNDLLIALIRQKENLANLLALKGISVSTNDKFNTLIPKVANLSDSSKGVYKKLYSFGVISDNHIKHTDYGEDTNNSVADYQRALTYCNDNGADFICIPGDMVANNRPANGSGNPADAEQEWIDELELFITLNEEYFSGKEVHFCTGNHDATPLGYNNAPEGLGRLVTVYEDGSKTAERVYKEITGRDLNYVYEHGDDIFIFHSMYYWNYVNYCRTEDVNWLGVQLETYKDKRVFLFAHCPLPNTFDGPSGNAGLSVLPEGQGGRSREFKTLIDQYPNVIWFNGHTHYDLNLEDDYENPNTFYTGTGATMIHCCSCAYPRIVGDPYVNVPAGSQGYMVDVYEDGIYVQGIDFTKGNGGAVIPSACYWIAT